MVYCAPSLRIIGSIYINHFETPTHLNYVGHNPKKRYPYPETWRYPGLGAQTVDIAYLPPRQDFLTKYVLMTAQRDFRLGNGL